MTTKLTGEGGGVEALVVGPQKKKNFFCGFPYCVCCLARFESHNGHGGERPRLHADLNQ